MFKLNYLPASKKLLILVNVWKIIHLNHGKRYVEMLLIIIDLNLFQAFKFHSSLVVCITALINQVMTLGHLQLSYSPSVLFQTVKVVFFIFSLSLNHFDLSLSSNFRWYSILRWLTCRHLWWVLHHYLSGLLLSCYSLSSCW